jgi:hypothetical protein
MPTYLYETLPGAGARARRFELRQRFDEPALTSDPLTGEAVQRVISGGLGVLSKGARSGAPSDPGAACGPETCQCGRFD